ncbi:MAG: polyprenyl synthetase family protein [Planctomycetota bacterium]|nr:polyprenyl synthetase family protein [Planctomycetota bacterium]
MPMTLTSVLAPVQSSLDEVETYLREEFFSRDGVFSGILSHVGSLRGKMIRPALMLLVGRACGGIRPGHIPVAALVEVMHTATLIHDDVLDDAVLRRRAETINQKYGNEASVLLGDLLFAQTFVLLSRMNLPEVSERFSEAAELICEGELHHILRKFQVDLTEADYLKIVEGKTATLFSLSGGLGAHLAEASDEIIQCCEKFGRSLGVAFQIIDDCIDVIGNEGDSGKSLGMDLTKGKVTLPVIRLVEMGTEGETLQNLFGQCNDLGKEDVGRLRRLLDESGAVDYARGMANQIAQEAKGHLDPLPDSPDKDALLSLTDLVLDRSA